MALPTRPSDGASPPGVHYPSICIRCKSELEVAKATFVGQPLVGGLSGQLPALVSSSDLFGFEVVPKFKAWRRGPGLAAKGSQQKSVPDVQDASAALPRNCQTTQRS